MPETRTVSVPSHDGGAMSARLAVPSSGSGPGVLVMHEIFGVNEYLDVVVERLAGLGYVALCPDLFWRIDPDHAIAQDEAGLGEAFERMGRFDLEDATRDCDAALGFLSRQPE